jgi:hypothetical protein
LQLLLVIEQVTEGELILARPQPLGLGAIKATLEQLVFMRQVDDGLLQRIDLHVTLGLECQHLGLQGGYEVGELFDGKLGLALGRPRARHLSSIHERDRSAQAQRAASDGGQ